MPHKHAYAWAATTAHTQPGMLVCLRRAVVPLTWTKAYPEAFLPHLEALATRVRELWDAGQIRAGGRSGSAPRHTGCSLQAGVLGAFVG